jgi:hypothetical protein
MTCIHEKIGPDKRFSADNGKDKHENKHVCVVDDEICCQYWFDQAQRECKYFVEGEYDEKKSRLALYEYNKKRYVDAIKEIDIEIRSLLEDIDKKD